MKVLFISSGNSKNGINPIVKNQGESLKYVGIDVHYFTIKGKGAFSYLRHISVLRKHIDQNNYNLFHAHYSLSAITASLAGCKPLVVSLMGSDIKSGILWKQILRIFAYLKWKNIILKSSSMKNDLRIKRAIVIPNGVDLNIVKPSDNQLHPKTKRILYAADPNRYVKNFSLAKSAISLLKNNSINFRIVHSKLHKEIIQEINNAEVLILSSRWEGSPNIIKEAMACNCPIVATDVGDVRWLLGDLSGHFISTFDPADFAEKIEFALDYSFKNGRTNGRERILKLGLDSKSIALRIKTVYANAIVISR